MTTPVEQPIPEEIDAAAVDDASGSGPARDFAPPPAQPSEVTFLLRIIVIAIVVGALYVGQDVLIPVTLAVMLSFVLSPLVNLLQRLRLWRVPAVAVSVLIALGVLGLLGTVIGSQAAALTADAPRYARTIEEKVEGIQALAAARLAALTLALRGPDIRHTTPPPSGAEPVTPAGRASTTKSRAQAAAPAKTVPADPLARDSPDARHARCSSRSRHRRPPRWSSRERSSSRSSHRSRRPCWS